MALGFVKGHCCMSSPSWFRSLFSLQPRQWAGVCFGIAVLLIEAAAIVAHPQPSAAAPAQVGGNTAYLPLVSNLMGPLIESRMLPIEVLGADNTTCVVTLDVPTGAVKLWLQIHNLSYQNKASVQINNGPWVNLSNSTPGLAVAEPGKRYGGIGGAFHTLKLSLDLVPGSVRVGTNTLRFRFNQTDGLSMGYRVIGLNFLNNQGQKLLPETALPEDNPNTWQPPLPSAADIAAGEQLWRTAVLKDSPLPAAITLKARCTSCHAQDGRDLKYFNFSNFAIVERAKFHGLSELQGTQIASYIRSLNVPNPGRPWNPPFQPGPGLDSKPIAEWSAGAGIDWALDKDSDTQQYIPGGGINRAALLDGNHIKQMNIQEIPIAFQLPDWNHWLPRIHPLDSVGSDFLTDPMYTRYQGIRTGLLGQADMSKEEYVGSRLRGDLDGWALHSLGGELPDALFSSLDPAQGQPWTATKVHAKYAVAVWGAVKQWEIMEEFGLDGYGKQFYGANGEARQWFSNRHLFNISPHILGMLDAPPVVGDAKGVLVNSYFANAWYEVQMLVNPGARHAVTGGHNTIDWGYMGGLFGDLNRASGYGEPMRATVFALKAMQEHDDGIGPDDTGWGWNVRDNVAGLNRSTSDNWAEQPNPKPIVQLTYQIWAEKSATFAIDQWRKTQGIDGANVPPLDYVLGTDQGEARERNVAEGLASDIRTLREKYQVDEALLSGMADFGMSIWANGGWDVLKAPPLATIGAPTNLQIAPDSQQIHLTWSPVAGATSYNVKRASTPDGVYRTVAYFVAGTSFTDRDLVAGASYFYRLSANSGRNVGGDSVVASGTPQHGLVSRWTFDARDGDRFLDAGSAENHGELIGAASALSGPRGQAIALDGQRLFVGVEQSLHRWLGGSATMTAWVQTTGTGTDFCPEGTAIAGVRAGGSPSQDEDSLWGCLDSTGHIGARFGWAGAQVMSAQAVNDGQWHQIAITRDAISGVISVYVDGVPSASGTSRTGQMGRRFFSIGRIDGTTNYWPGALDDVRIYDSVLSAAEVQQVFQDTSVLGTTSHAPVGQRTEAGR